MHNYFLHNGFDSLGFEGKEWKEGGQLYFVLEMRIEGCIFDEYFWKWRESVLRSSHRECHKWPRRVSSVKFKCPRDLKVLAAWRHHWATWQSTCLNEVISRRCFSGLKHNFIYTLNAVVYCFISFERTLKAYSLEWWLLLFFSNNEITKSWKSKSKV